jgi:hypothetical protein
MRKWIWWMLVWAALPLRAEVLSDADDDKLEAVIQQSLASPFALWITDRAIFREKPARRFRFP